MKYLLDTHVIMWVLLDDDRIPKDLKKEILDTNNQVYYSTISTWEIEMKHQKIKKFSFTGEQLSFLCDQNYLINIPLKNEHIAKLKEVKPLDDSIIHKDPFDRMLLAQALHEDMILVTHDRKFRAYSKNNILII